MSFQSELNEGAWAPAGAPGVTRRQWLTSVPTATVAAVTLAPGGALLALGAAPLSAMAAPPTGVSGGVQVVPGTAGSWPSTEPLAPSAALTQGCLNGNELHVVLSHQAATGHLRTLSLTLRSKLGWTDGKALKLGVGSAGPDGTLEGTLVCASSSTSASRMAYGIAAGSVQATRQGGFVTLVFSPTASSTDVVVASRLVSFTGNSAPASSSVLIGYQLAASARTVTLSVVSESTGSV